MSTYTQLLYHIVFSTKNREKVLLKENREKLYRYIWGVLKHHKKDVLINYVKNQEEHHKKVSFKDEYISLLKEHGIEFDEKYLF